MENKYFSSILGWSATNQCRYSFMKKSPASYLHGSGLFSIFHSFFIEFLVMATVIELFLFSSHILLEIQPKILRESTARQNVGFNFCWLNKNMVALFCICVSISRTTDPGISSTSTPFWRRKFLHWWLFHRWYLFRLRRSGQFWKCFYYVLRSMGRRLHTFSENHRINSQSFSRQRHIFCSCQLLGT